MTKELATSTDQQLTPLVDMQALVDAAIKQGAAVEVLDRLEQMRQNMVAERAEREYAEAMRGFQSEVPIIPKERDGDKGKWKYAPIEDILSYRKPTPNQPDYGPTIQQLITKYGFSYEWKHRLDNGVMTVTCTVRHIGGYKKETDASFPVVPSGSMNKSQEGGSAMSYGQRYSFKGAFGLVTGGVDDDGQAACPPEERITTQQYMELENQVHEYISSWQQDLKEVTRLVDGWMNGAAMSFGLKSKKLSDLPAHQFEAAKELLAKKISEHKEKRK